MCSNVMNPLYKKSTIIIALAACIFMTVIMSIQGRPLRTNSAPAGIVSLELAWQPSNANEIKQEWASNIFSQKTLTQTAFRNILIDFIYIGAYGLFFILLCLRSAQLLPAKKLLKSAAIMAFAAGAFDASENLLMLYTLQKEAIPLLTACTAFAALVKFSLLAIVVLLLLFSWIKHKLSY